jgi:Uma2 family endonuclease
MGSREGRKGAKGAEGFQFVAIGVLSDNLSPMNAPSPRLDTLEKARLRVEDFLLLDRSGAFGGNRRTELIEGDIYYMNAQYRPHARVKAKLYDELRDWVRSSGSALTVMIETTVAMPPHNAPEPDLVLTSEPDGDGPIPVASVALLIEIADTTLKDDLGIKAKTYAAQGVPEYWVADVNGRVIHQMWSLGEGGYAARRVVGFGEKMAAETLVRLVFDTSGLG